MVAGMASWWHRDMIAPGKLPLMLCFLAFVVTFVVTRTITRMIRDGRGPFRNHVTASGTHIHHSVPGIILLIIWMAADSRDRGIAPAAVRAAAVHRRTHPRGRAACRRAAAIS